MADVAMRLIRKKAWQEPLEAQFVDSDRNLLVRARARENRATWGHARDTRASGRLPGEIEKSRLISDSWRGGNSAHQRSLPAPERAARAC